MRLSDLVPPVTPTHRDDRQLGQDDGATDSSCHLLGALHTQTNMPVVVTHCNKGLQSKQTNQTQNQLTIQNQRLMGTLKAKLPQYFLATHSNP